MSCRLPRANIYLLNRILQEWFKSSFNFHLGVEKQRVLSLSYALIYPMRVFRNKEQEIWASCPAMGASLLLMRMIWPGLKMYLQNQHMQRSRGMRVCASISFHVVDLRTSVYVSPTMPMVFGWDLCHVRVTMLVSYVLICEGYWWEKCLKMIDSLYFCWDSCPSQYLIRGSHHHLSLSNASFSVGLDYARLIASLSDQKCTFNSST